MTLKADWFGFAEGVANDSRGVATLVGFDPQILTYKTFPATGNIVLVLILDDDETPEPILVLGKTLSIAVTFRAPDNEVVFAHQVSAAVGEKRIEHLRSRIQLLLQFPITFAKPGGYTASISIRAPGSDEPIEASRELALVEDS